MKTIKFAPHLVPLVLSGEKTATWRLFDDKDLQVGDEVECLNKETGERFGGFTITSVREKPLKDIDDSDYDGHERFGSQEEMFAQYQKYYGDQVTLDTPVKMIKFSFTADSV